MNDAPKKIWAVAGVGCVLGFNDYDNGGGAYIREDVAKARIEELKAERDAAVAAAYEDAAKISVDYVNGDLAQPEMGIWWNIMQRAPADFTSALERVRREARNEALERALAVAELYPRPHGSRIANEIRAMMEHDDT